MKLDNLFKHYQFINSCCLLILCMTRWTRLLYTCQSTAGCCIHGSLHGKVLQVLVYIMARCSRLLADRRFTANCLGNIVQVSRCA